MSTSDLPASTRAVVIQADRTVGVNDLPLPPLGSGEVLVRTLATPIHPADLNAIEGKYPGTPKPPFVGGREGAGEIVALGPEVSTWSVGDLVLLPPGAGTWREYTTHPADLPVAVPAGVAPEQAALLRVNPGTALRMLRDFVDLQPGEWIVQNAGNSAVGRAVCQLARHFGWHTVNLVRDPASIDPELRAVGDVFLADNASADLVAAAGGKVRLALNAVGGESALRLANALADGGTHVTYGAMARQPLRLPNGLLIFQDISFRGFWMKRWAEIAGLPAMVAMLEELGALAARGVIHSQVARTYSFDECAEAVAHAGQSQRGGKILFRA